MRPGPGGCLDLRIQRGKTVRLDVTLQATASTVLELATRKHEAIDQNLRAGPYMLLYPDASPVEHIPGGEEPFTVGSYQKFMGGPFDRLTLYICPCTEYGSE